MAKKKYVVTMTGGGIFVETPGEPFPVKKSHGAIIELDEQEARQHVLANRIRLYDKAFDADPSSGDSDDAA